MGDRLIHADLSHRIIGAAMTVLNELKSGLDEKFTRMLYALNCATWDMKSTNNRVFPSSIVRI